MASEFDLNFDEPVRNISWLWVEYKKTPKGHGSTLEETRPLLVVP